ncbi:unnamed protein product [Camellia sinensis]
MDDVTVVADAILSRLVSDFGARNWSLIARGISGRSGKSCRLRWCNQLDPAVKRKPFTDEEDRIIVQAHTIHGNKWASIARLLQERSKMMVHGLETCPVVNSSVNIVELLSIRLSTSSKGE